jgi:hypothetical protein
MACILFISLLLYTSPHHSVPGTSVSVFATLDNYPISTYNFTVDGAHASTWAKNAPSPTFHQQVYTSGTLDDGEHQLELNLVSANDTGTSLDNFFDYIIYTPSQNASLANTNSNQYLFIDDTSPYIHYSSSGWTQNGASDFNANSFYSYNNSINMASSAGAQATVYFEGQAKPCPHHKSIGLIYNTEYRYAPASLWCGSYQHQSNSHCTIHPRWKCRQHGEYPWIDSQLKQCCW